MGYWPSPVQTATGQKLGALRRRCSCADSVLSPGDTAITADRLAAWRGGRRPGSIPTVHRRTPRPEPEPALDFVQETRTEQKPSPSLSSSRRRATPRRQPSARGGQSECAHLVVKRDDRRRLVLHPPGSPRRPFASNPFRGVLDPPHLRIAASNKVRPAHRLDPVVPLGRPDSAEIVPTPDMY